MGLIGVIRVLLAAASVAWAVHALAELADAVTKAQFDAWMNELSNWGDDDQLGAVNLITPTKRLEAVRLVTHGRMVSMARPMVIDAELEPSEQGTD